MSKRISLALILALLLALLTGCTGTPVVYTVSCTCPTTVPATEAPAQTQMPAAPAAEGALKTGLYIGTSLADSKNATAEENGEVKYDVTVVAVTVDENSVIQSCIIDSIPASVAFDAAGAITSDLSASVLTKNELGENYGMKKYAGSAYEWNEQVAAVAEYAVGKTAEELVNGAVNESGKAVDADLASTATIYIGGYISGIVEAANNAQALGAQAGDELRLAIVPGVSGSTGATAEAAGNAQLDADVTALTLKDGVITSCYIDALQAKVAFDATGVITSDLSSPVLTKNQLGENYGMKKYAGSAYEWNEQAAAFARYATGKTAAQVKGMAVNEKTAPTDADLASTVTIAVGGFQNLIEKAAK